MRQCSQRKGVFVYVRRFEDQVLHEITRSDVMSEVAEKFTSERIVTHVVNETATVRMGISNSQILVAGLRKTDHEQRLDVLLPCQIHDVLMGQQRKRESRRSNGEDTPKKQKSPKKPFGV